jgi:hypothetical protein
MTTWKTLLAGAATVLALAAPSSAQSPYSGKVTLPFDVQWGRASLAAGEYTFVLRSIGRPMEIVDDNGRTRALVYGSAESPRMSRGASILVTQDGGKRWVRSLNCPAWGVNFVYKPFTRAERDLLASGRQIEQLPIRLASR